MELEETGMKRLSEQQNKEVYVKMGGGSLGLIVRGSVLVLFLFYVNVSRMYLQSHLPFQPLTIPGPWVFLSIGWTIPWFHPG